MTSEPPAKSIFPALLGVSIPLIVTLYLVPSAKTIPVASIPTVTVDPETSNTVVPILVASPAVSTEEMSTAPILDSRRCPPQL